MPPVSFKEGERAMHLCALWHCDRLSPWQLSPLHTSTVQLAAAAHALPLTWPWRSEPRCRRGSQCQRSSAPTCGTFVRRCIGSAAASGERAVPGPAPGLWQHAELQEWKTSTSSLHRMHLSLQTSTAGPLQISAWTPHHTTPLLDLRTAWDSTRCMGSSALTHLPVRSLAVKVRPSCVVISRLLMWGAASR